MTPAAPEQPSRSRQRREPVHGEAAPPSGAATPGQAARDALRALLDEVFDDIGHVVDGNVGWIDRDMLDRYREDAAAYLAKPHWTERLGPVVACEHVAAQERPAPELADDVHVDWHMTPGEWRQLYTVLGQHAGDTPYIARLIEAGKVPALFAAQQPHAAPAPDDGRTPGQVAYEAYGKAIPEEAFPEPLRGMGWTSWEEIPEWERLAYEAAARAVAARQPGTAWRLLEELRGRLLALAARIDGFAATSPARIAQIEREAAIAIRQALEP